jgi:hypothetical protein
MDQFADRIVAVGLLTRRDLDLLGPTFERAWPIEEADLKVQEQSEQREREV